LTLGKKRGGGVGPKRTQPNMAGLKTKRGDVGHYYAMSRRGERGKKRITKSVVGCGKSSRVFSQTLVGKFQSLPYYRKEEASKKALHQTVGKIGVWETEVAKSACKRKK